MAILTEGARTAEFLQSEANGHRSRDVVTLTVAANTTVSPGRVLGRITATGKFLPQLDAAIDGSENAAAILYSAVENDTGSSADFDAVVVSRDAEIKIKDVIYDPASAAAAKLVVDAALAALGIIVRA